MTIEICATDVMKDAWAVQDQAYPGTEWMDLYWSDLDGTHRDGIIDALAQVAPFRSVLEVGCHCGPNLRRIHARWPQVALHGMDIHGGAIQHGQLAAKAEGWCWVGYQGDLRALPDLGTDAVDVALSCYALAYLDPRDIDGVLSALWAVARRAVVLCEPMALSGEDETYWRVGRRMPEYVYAYQDRVARLFAGAKSVLAPLAQPHQRLTHTLTLLKPSA